MCILDIVVLVANSHTPSLLLVLSTLHDFSSEVFPPDELNQQYFGCLYSNSYLRVLKRLCSS